jgi:prepilin-type N-terminal cleavage/methylation domain-containing protein
MRKIRAFTLIELLISISIFSILTVVLYSCFRTGITSYRRILEQAEYHQGMRYLFSVIEKDIKNIFILPDMPFGGRDKEAFFMTMFTDRNGFLYAGRAGYYLKRESENGPAMLIRRKEPLHQAMADSFFSFNSQDKTNMQEASDYEEILSEYVSNIRFRYLYAVTEKIPEGENSVVSFEWADEWSEYSLPVAVEVELVFSGSGNILPSTVLKRVHIPTADPLDKP